MTRRPKNLENAVDPFVEKNIEQCGQYITHVSTVLAKMLRGVVFISGVVIGLCILGFLLISRSLARPLIRISEGMNQNALQISAAAAEVASTSQSLAAGASEQAAALEETSAASEQLTAMTKQDAAHAAAADQAMKESSLVLEKAEESMQRLTGSMGEISRASADTQKIIKTIDEIAFQTNLLALNAAVEAARAGELGAGFAIVAGEVRELARRAAESARETSQLIESTIRKVETGSRLANETSASFATALQQTARISQIINNIVNSTTEQTRSIGQTSKALLEIDDVTQRNSAAAEQAAAAAEELNSQAIMMQNGSTELVALVFGRGKTSLASRVSPVLQNKVDGPAEIPSAPSRKIHPPGGSPP